jgi:hypothetical protein
MLRFLSDIYHSVRVMWRAWLSHVIDMFQTMTSSTTTPDCGRTLANRFYLPTTANDGSWWLNQRCYIAGWISDRGSMPYRSKVRVARALNAASAMRSCLLNSCVHAWMHLVYNLHFYILVCARLVYIDLNIWYSISESKYNNEDVDVALVVHSKRTISFHNFRLVPAALW